VDKDNIEYSFQRYLYYFGIQKKRLDLLYFIW
jgi:hypothetical protein